MNTIKDEIAKNLLFYRKQKQLTQKELANKIGVKHNTISGWESGANSVDIEYLFDICKALEISINDMYGVFADKDIYSNVERQHLQKYRALDGHGLEVVNNLIDSEIHRIDKERTAAKEAARRKAESATRVTAHKQAQKRSDTEMAEAVIDQFPLYGMPAAAGLGNYVDESPDYELVDVEMGDVPYGADILIRISGNSMEPEYYDGDVVFVRATVELEDGDVGIFVVDGEAYCKKLIRKGRNAWLSSFNEQYADMNLSDYSYCRTVGRVLGVWRGVRA